MSKFKYVVKDMHSKQIFAVTDYEGAKESAQRHSKENYVVEIRKHQSKHPKLIDIYVEGVQYHIQEITKLKLDKSTG